MIYIYEGMYRILDKYVQNSISAMDHAFIMELKWPDSFVLSGLKSEFWSELQEMYDITITEEERKAIETVKDLKIRLRANYI